METIESLGKYEIKRPLGRGAMGTVYEGWDPIIARRVAIKTVKLPENADDPETEEALARFRREAQAAGRLIHPNIVGVFDYGETNDVAYIVMEFVDGPPLKNLLDKQERFALPDVVRVMEDLLTGLQFSHERGVVHRDIKPANVMLTSAGQAKIADFGIARIESSSMTQAGTLLGTPAYMSPEQFMGQVVDARSDIYSSGVLLYQLLTGERPFEGGLSAIMHKALNTEPPWPSQLSVTAPPAFDVVVKRAMAKRPEERYASATAFLEAVRAALHAPSAPAEEPVVSEDEATMVAAPAPRSAPVTAAPAAAARPVSPAPSAPAKRSSPMPMIAAAAALVIVAGGGGAWYFLSQPSAPSTGTPSTTTTASTAPAAPTPAPPAATPAPPPSSPTSAQTEQTAQVTPPPVGPTPPPTPPVSVAPPPVAPTPVQPATPPPDTQQTAAISLGNLRTQIAQWVTEQHCALLGGAVGDSGAVTLAGYAGDPSVDQMRQGLASLAPNAQLNWQVNGVNQVFCPALDLLRPTVPAFGATGVSRLLLQMADNKTQLHDGQQVRVHLAMPDFAGRLRVDYIGHDGSVQHLYPQIADPKNSITADPPRTWNASQIVDLSNPVWTIGPPYGTDMIIAVASSQPLFERSRPQNGETAAIYLRDLQAAIDGARQRGERLAGAAITLDALPK
ncbi:MAG TPA: protein kinase [Acetobacteraceae bacterium]|nr:protein kinase [Acetobacteraceae bacterium]